MSFRGRPTKQMRNTALRKLNRLIKSQLTEPLFHNRQRQEARQRVFTGIMRADSREEFEAAEKRLERMIHGARQIQEMEGKTAD